MGTILLIHPRSFSITQVRPCGLAYISSSLARAGRRARLLDMQLNRDRDLDELLANPSIDWVGLSVSIQNISSARAIIARVRERLPGCPIVVGGTYPTCLPEKWHEHLDADMAVIGEGEESVLLLDHALAAGRGLDKVPGLSWREEGGLRATPAAPFVRDLDSLAMPDYDQMPPAAYSKVPWQIFKKGRVVGSILTSRGCPHNCGFCAASTMMGRTWRPRSPELVGEEMEIQRRRHGADEIHIMDDNLIGTRDHAAAFCEEILRRDLRISWKTPNGVRAELLDRPLLSLMKRSGCYTLGFGIESGDPEVLAGVGKRVSLDALAEKIRLTREAGILTSGYFILGLPGDTPASIERTIAKALTLDLDFAHFNFFVPYPGSRMFAELSESEQERVCTRGWHFLPYPPEGMSEAQLRKLHRRACWTFFRRPRNIRVLAGLMDANSALPFARATAYYFFGHFLPKGNGTWPG